MTTQLAVYRIVKGVYGAHEDTDGRGDFYFIAPAGLDRREADRQRVSEYYVDHIVALGEMIEMQHDYSKAKA